MRTDVQYACSVSNAAGVHGPIDNLWLHLRRLTGIGILQQEGATRTALLAAAVALLALTGLPMSNNIGAVTVGAVQHLDDHGASPSCGCFGSSHWGIDRSTSTPLRHLRRFFQIMKERLRSPHRRPAATEDGGQHPPMPYLSEDGTLWPRKESAGVAVAASAFVSWAAASLEERVSRGRTHGRTDRERERGDRAVVGDLCRRTGARRQRPHILCVRLARAGVRGDEESPIH